jgi:hypothetical protein
MNPIVKMRTIGTGPGPMVNGWLRCPYKD